MKTYKRNNLSNEQSIKEERKQENIVIANFRISEK
jgi:hypothetical protein